MNENELNAEWEKDSKINIERIDLEQARFINLHAKYSTLLSKVRAGKSRAIVKRKETALLLFKYYKGELNNKDDIKLINRDYWPQKLLKTDLIQYIEADKDFLDCTKEVDYFDRFEKTLEGIMKELSNRSHQIKNIIEWQKYILGN